MFLLGLLAIIQILFLPGLIFKSLFKPRGEFFYQLSVVVAVSMLFNATIIYPLVLLHIYNRPVLVGIIIIEFIAFLWLYRGVIRINLEEIGKRLGDYVKRQLLAFQAIFQSGNYSAFTRSVRTILIILIIILSTSLIYWFFRKIPNNIGTVFNAWDAVVSWNHWAQVWAQNLVPEVPLTYPQLLPLNLSLTYLLTGNDEISLFAKAIMPVFALLTVLMVFEMGLKEKKYGILAAVIFIYLLYKKFLGEIIADGYADVPVAFFALTALVPFLESGELLKDKKALLLSLLVAAGAVLTKQVGLFVLVFLPVAALLTRVEKGKKQTLQLLVYFGIALLLTLPWYLPMGINILKDFSKSGIGQYIAISSAVQGNTSTILRFGSAFLNLGKYLVFFVFIIPAFFLVNRRYRVFILMFLIPFSILWGIISSYDERNLSIVFVGVSLVAGLGMEVILEFVFRAADRSRINELNSLFLALLVLIPLGYFTYKLTSLKLTAAWEAAQNNIFSPEINQQVRALDRSNPVCQRILTNYPVAFLPGLKDMQLNTYFSDYEDYVVQIEEPDVCWMLVPNYANALIQENIEQNLNSGKFTLLFSTENWVPYRLIRIK